MSKLLKKPKVTLLISVKQKSVTLKDYSPYSTVAENQEALELYTKHLDKIGADYVVSNENLKVDLYVDLDLSKFVPNEFWDNSFGFPTEETLADFIGMYILELYKTSLHKVIAKMAKDALDESGLPQFKE